jgi:hypothetical protein
LLSKALKGLWTTDRAATNQMTIPFNKLPWTSHENCLPSTPKFTSTVLAVERTVLAEDSSDGSFQGSPSILSRKKKRSKMASSSIFDAQNPHSSSSKEMEETNAKNEFCKSRNNESKSVKIPRSCSTLGRLQRFCHT